MYSRDKPLFMKVSVYDSIEGQKKSIANQAEKIPEERLLNEDLNLLVQELARQHSVAVPTIDRSEISASEPQEVEIDFRGGDDFRFNRHGARRVKGTSVTLRVPFTGDKEAFYVRPTRASLPPPQATVVQPELQLTFSGVDLNAQQVKSEFESALNEIDAHLATLRTDFQAFNSQVVDLAQGLLTERKKRIQQRKDFADGLGYRIR